jgi:hypothetical protein
VHLNVLGFVRMAETNETAGSVTFITHIGRIMLEGTELSYFDDIQVCNM